MRFLRGLPLAVAIGCGTVPAVAQPQPSPSSLADLLDRITVEPRDVRALIARGAGLQAPGGTRGPTPLLMAIDRAGGPFRDERDLAIVRILIAAGADVSGATRSETPLCKAIASGRAEDLVVLLLRAGADPNVPCGWDTPLGKAVMYRSVEIGGLLLAAGAKPPSMAGRINEDPVLHKAASYGPARMVALLIRHGAPVDERSYDMGTPLMRARNVGVARALVAAGADVHVRNRSGQSALAFHVQAGHEEIAAFLRARGAREDVVPPPRPPTP